MNALAKPATTNPDWGFWGIMSGNTDPAGDPANAWELAMEAIGAATHCPDTAVRDFLDSRHGRHFADDVAGGLFTGIDLAAAVTAAVERWMGWTIDRRIERETGIPRGLPYLAGFVAHFEILAEDAA